MKKRDWCFPLLHDWGQWVDIAEFQIRQMRTKAVQRKGIVQERRCKRCNLAHRRDVCSP